MGGIFEGLGKAEVCDKGSYLNPGLYVVKVDRLLVKKSRESGIGVIGELDVLQSTFRPQVDPKNQGRTWQNTPVGVFGTWWQGLEVDGALGSVKGFCRAALGLSTTRDQAVIAELDSPLHGTSLSLIDNVMNWATSEANTFAGFLVNLECFMIETQKRKQDFTVHNWSPFDFAQFGIQPPDVRVIMAQARTPAPRQAQERAPAQQGGWGQPPPIQGPPPGYGPAFGPPQGYGAPAAPAWGQPPAAPVRTPPSAPAVWTPPPGSSFSQDGIWYAPPGGQWVRIPGR